MFVLWGRGGSASTGHHSLFGIKELLSMLGEEVIQSATSAAGGGSHEPGIIAGGCRTVCIYLFSWIEAQSELICVIKSSDFRQGFIDPD